MNQILVTEKIYVTPELRRKKKIYKMLFILSVFLIISLFSVYIYAEYDRNKEESISDDILSSMMQFEDETTISLYENALVVKITQEMAEQIEMEENAAYNQGENLSEGDSGEYFEEYAGEFVTEQGENQQQIQQQEQERGQEVPNQNQVQNQVQQQEIQQSQMATATSTYIASNGKKYETIGIVKIPKFNITYPILAKTTNALLKVAPCKFHGTNPNEVGNLCIIAHNYRRKGVFFSDVPDLVIGDIVEIQDLSQRIIRYEVYDVHTVLPDNVQDTSQKTNGRKEVTLITCTDDSRQRVIVKCREKK